MSAESVTRDPHPMQQIRIDAQNVPRFRANALVQHLVHHYPDRLNGLAGVEGVSPDDWEQLAQLIGYSVAGFGDLSYANPATVEMADIAAVLLSAGEVDHD